jgi:hypothetical protein
MPKKKRSKPIETGWSKLIERVHTDTKWSREFCTNMVIFQFLQEGNLEPLREMLAAGFRPDEKILLYLAEMMDPNGKTPFRVDTKKRGIGHPTEQAQNFMRDLEIAEAMRCLMKDGATYDAARTQVAKEKNVSKSTVRDAYKHWFTRDN